MTKYQYITAAYEIVENSFTENRKEFISSLQGLEGNIYCSFVGFVNSYLEKFKYFKSMIDEIDDEIQDSTELNYVEALYEVVKKETGITLKRETCKEVINYLKENEKKIEYFI